MATLDFNKLPADQHITVVVAPSGGSTLGFTDVAVPLAAEWNNTGGTSGAQPASQSISWNDWDFGVQESETANEPSFADASTYEEFTTTNFGGSISYFRPKEHDDLSNQHAVIQDLTFDLGHLVDIGVRIDGAKLTSTPGADGDFVSIYRVQGDAETNSMDLSASVTRTVTYLQKGDFSHYTILGAHVITAVPPATTPWKAGNKARLRATVQSRDFTNALSFSTDDPETVVVYPGGFYEVTGTAGDTANITIRDEDANTQVVVPVLVTA